MQGSSEVLVLSERVQTLSPRPLGAQMRTRWALIPPPARRGAAAAVALFVAVIVLLVVFDWNWMRGPVGRIASAQLNRKVEIVGDLRVHPWSLSPRVEALDVRIGQPDWAMKADPKLAPMARVQRLAVVFKVLPLFRGQVVLPLLAVDRPDVRLMRNASGQANWAFGARTAKAKPLKLPAIQHFVIHDGALQVDDRQRDVLFVGSVSSNEQASGEGRGRFVLEGKGSLNRAPFTARITGGPLLNITPDRPYPFDARVAAGATRILAQGSVTRPFDLGRFETAVTVSGSDMNRLYALTGLTLPNTPPYRVSGKLIRKGGRFDFTGMTGRIGDSDIAGDLFVLTDRERPYLEADLQSRRLDFDDLGSLVGAAPATGRGETASAGQKVEAGRRDATQRLLPDATLQTERVRAMDAKVKYRALAVNAPGWPMKKVRVEVDLDRGVLTLDPIALTFARGDLSGKIVLDARPDVPRTQLDLRLSNAKLEDFIPVQSGGKPIIEGPVMARARLSAVGDSIHRAASSANGTVTLVSPHGQVRQAFAELLGVNLSKGVILLLSKNNREASVRCAVADFTVRNGVMTTNHLVADTGVVLVRGKGQINLETERMDFRIEGDSKKPRLLRLFVPITVSGPFMAPKVGFRPSKAVSQGGVAAALGTLVNPLAALLPFITTGEAKNADCEGLVADARGQGAPVKVAQTTAAKK